ncbi:MAG: hypothetical protein HZB29_09355 [Nitrospinae bacterium]|nr:hypothetical protein [Nitrospinota bacterium]
MANGGLKRKTLIILAGLLGVKLAMLAASGLGIGATSAAPAFAQEAGAKKETESRPATTSEEVPGQKGAPLKTGETLKDAAKEKEAKQPASLDLEIIQEVEKRQKAMDKKEEELKQKEDRLNALQTDLDKQISELKAAQAKIEDLIKQRGDLEDEAVKKLAKTYSSMPPENAAALIQQLDSGIAIRILSNMKERNAARILAVIPKDKATKLSEGMVMKK